MEFHVDNKDAPKSEIYFHEIEHLYHRVRSFLLPSLLLIAPITASSCCCCVQDEFSNLVQDWNAQRSEALERALTSILYPQLAREVKTKLLEEAKEHIMRVSGETTQCRVASEECLHAGVVRVAGVSQEDARDVGGGAVQTRAADRRRGRRR